MVSYGLTFFSVCEIYPNGRRRNHHHGLRHRLLRESHEHVVVVAVAVVVVVGAGEEAGYVLQWKRRSDRAGWSWRSFRIQDHVVSRQM